MSMSLRPYKTLYLYGTSKQRQTIEGEMPHSFVYWGRLSRSKEKRIKLKPCSNCN
jgi:hypothetical protein